MNWAQRGDAVPPPSAQRVRRASEQAQAKSSDMMLFDLSTGRLVTTEQSGVAAKKRKLLDLEGYTQPGISRRVAQAARAAVQRVTDKWFGDAAEAPVAVNMDDAADAHSVQTKSRRKTIDW